MPAMSASQSCAADSVSRIKYGLQVEGRAADRLEHVGGGGLLLQRFAQLVEQARVLDGDDGLAGEVLHQFDLLVGEGANLLAVDGKDADQLVVLEHRNVKDGPEASEIDGSHEDRFALDVGWLRRDIDDMNRLLRLDDAAEGSSRTRSLRSALPELGKCWRHSEHCSRTPCAILKTEQNTETGLADAHRIRQHGLEHGLKFAGRAGDDLQHVGGRGLLLQRFAKSRVRACTSSNSRTFSIAITAWSAKVFTRPICPLVNGRTSRRAQPMTPIGFPSLSIGTAMNVRYFSVRWSTSRVRKS